MIKDKTALMSTAYLAPIQYYTKFLFHSNFQLEQHENYMKQTYRNRCVILGANGPQALTIPVVKGRSKTPTKDLRIAYDTEWQRLHWRSITAAYNSSPFFEYLEDEFLPFFTKRVDFLLDFNQELQQTVFDLMEIKPSIELTKEYIMAADENMFDYRTLLSPKSEGKWDDIHFKQKEYIQTFHDKMDFVPNLSILDLLFNEGGNAYDILAQSIVGVNSAEE